MSEFSKEWCEENDPLMPYDFSIKEEFEKLEDGYFIYIICEGYGFVAINNDGGQCRLGYEDVMGNLVWRKYDI
jgi:hypothetical protein